jgi:hypothetical protein
MQCVTALLLMRKQLGKPFKDAAKADIRSILKWMEEKGYKAPINEKFRQVSKIFYLNFYIRKRALNRGVLLLSYSSSGKILLFKLRDEAFRNCLSRMWFNKGKARLESASLLDIDDGREPNMIFDNWLS